MECWKRITTISNENQCPLRDVWNFSYFLKWCIDSPQQNGGSKRKHHHLIAIACSLLLSFKVFGVF